jgi:hypothetical protein
MVGKVIAVYGAVLDKRDQPYKGVGEWVDEHESELAVDAAALASVMALGEAGVLEGL